MVNTKVSAEKQKTIVQLTRANHSIGKIMKETNLSRPTVKKYQQLSSNTQ